MNYYDQKRRYKKRVNVSAKCTAASLLILVAIAVISAITATSLPILFGVSCFTTLILGATTAFFEYKVYQMYKSRC